MASASLSAAAAVPTLFWESSSRPWIRPVARITFLCAATCFELPSAEAERYQFEHFDLVGGGGRRRVTREPLSCRLRGTPSTSCNTGSRRSLRASTGLRSTPRRAIRQHDADLLFRAILLVVTRRMSLMTFSADGFAASVLCLIVALRKVTMIQKNLSLN